MKHSSFLSVTARAVQRIDGFSSVYCTSILQAFNYYTSTWKLDGCEWEVRVYPWHSDGSSSGQVALKLIFLGDAGVNKPTAYLSCRLVDPSGSLPPSPERMSAPASFQRPSESSETFCFMSCREVLESVYHKSDDSLSIEYAITVSRDPLMAITTVQPSILPQHLGELLESKVGADVTFIVSGESFAAHKNVLAARSPVFMAEFFGEMQGKTSGLVKIRGMEPSVFGAMLRFIYTDAVPELCKMDAGLANLAQHLLVAADRYQLDRLKVLCECRLAFAIDSSTAATTLSLAERHGCSQLKAKCVEFIAGGSRENLDEVMKTEGFKDLMANSPTLLAELLVAAHEVRSIMDA
jgi:speckle-type POZ protein